MLMGRMFFQVIAVSKYRMAEDARSYPMFPVQAPVLLQTLETKSDGEVCLLQMMWQSRKRPPGGETKVNLGRFLQAQTIINSQVMIKSSQSQWTCFQRNLRSKTHRLG